MMSKPRMSAEVFFALNQVTQAFNAARRSAFAGAAVGGDPFADMKHTKAWFDYGYPGSIDFYMHWNMYKRNGLARAGINIPHTICWLDHPKLVEGDNADSHDETDWERQCRKVFKRLKLTKHISDCDRMQMVGRYAALFFRVRDGLPASEPLSPGFTADKIVEVIPVWEGQLQPGTICTDEKSDHFGRPLNYNYSESGHGNQDPLASRAFMIDRSRLVILAEGSVGGSIYGEPANEAGFNALLDWDKTRGSGGEASWLAAANKQVLTSNKPNARITPEIVEEINDQLKRLREGLDEFALLNGVEAAPMTATVPEPRTYKEMILEEYAASREIPVKILVGTQTGVLAGDADTSGYMRIMMSRRVNVLNDFVTDVTDWLIFNGVIPQPPGGEYSIYWSDLTAPSAAMKMEYGLKMAQINQLEIMSNNETTYSTAEIREDTGYSPDKPSPTEFGVD